MPPSPGKPSASGSLSGGLAPPTRRIATAPSETRLLRSLDELSGVLRDAADIHRAVRLALRHACTLLSADGACAAILEPGRPEAAIACTTGGATPGPASGSTLDTRWDRALLASFARGHKTPAPSGLALARLKRRGRPWGALALGWTHANPDWSVRNALTRIARIVNDAIEDIERRRLADVRARIDRKVMEQLRPKDLCYQILDGLRSLTGYDHSAILLVADGDAASVEVAAEQLAWRKGKSTRIGARLPMTDPWRSALAEGRARGYSRRGAAWTPWDHDAPDGLGRWLADGLPPERADGPAEAEVIVAPLHTGRDLLAILRFSAQHPGSFGPYEAELVESFLPYALVALQNAQRTETLQTKMIQAERKTAMADLARGVSHDINNALGAVLPLVQQIQSDLAAGKAEPATLRADLDQIEKSLRACSRIFGGMLQFARRSAAERSPNARTAIDPALDSALTILGDSLSRHGIAVERRIPADLPEVPLAQAELEQVLLNLISNAKDSIAALGAGGNLLVAARREGPSGVRLEIIDDGGGIGPADLARVMEPFFTTKATGTGLGLSIVRSLIWQAQGRITVESPAYPSATNSRPGARFIVTLPAAAAAVVP